MGDEDTVRAQAASLDAALGRALTKYILYARTNYTLQQSLTWGSLLASGAAAVLGLTAAISQKQLGALAAASAALVGASHQLGFQQKANWHYRKADAITALRRRMAYEIPLPPSANDIAALSREWSTLDLNMSQQWEDMQPEPPRRK